MLYWILWLVLGLALNVTFSVALPLSVNKLRRCYAERSYVHSLLWLGVSALLTAADIFVFCWGIATFVEQSCADYPCGYLSDGGSFVYWPICVAAGIFAAGFAAGAVLLRRTACEKPSADVEVPVGNIGGKAFTAARITALVLAIAMSAVILTLIADYVLLHETDLFTAKRLVLGGVAAELVAAGVVCAVFRKAVWKRRCEIMFSLCGALFVLFVGLHILLAHYPRDTVEAALLFGGTWIFIVLPMAFTVAMMFWLGLRKRDRSETSPTVR